VIVRREYGYYFTLSIAKGGRERKGLVLLDKGAAIYGHEHDEGLYRLLSPMVRYHGVVAAAPSDPASSELRDSNMN
jgi:hypothetical protein